MPKVDYEKQPFRLCRWNTRPHDFEKHQGFYFCEDSNEYVKEDYCMQCFCNEWFENCCKCGKNHLKTELVQIFLPEFKMGYICNKCYNGEELVQRTLSLEEENIIYNIKKWKKLRG